MILKYGTIRFICGSLNQTMMMHKIAMQLQEHRCFFTPYYADEKEVHTYLDAARLRELMPIQNGGVSAMRIASACRRLLLTPMPVLQQVRRGLRTRPRWEADKI